MSAPTSTADLPNRNTSLLLDINHTALHALSEAEVFCALVDCFRMRVEDENKFKGKNMGILDGHSRCVPDFATFLDLAESREGLLPSWWSPEKRTACEAFSVQQMRGRYKDLGHAEGNIFAFTDKKDIMEHYADNAMPMKLRILGEEIYGTSIV